MKTLPGFETILLVPCVEINGVPWIATPTGLVDYENPTAAAMNLYRAITKPSDPLASQGGNISCAVLDDLNLGLTGSDRGSSKTICSKGNTESLTFYNFNVELNAKRDKGIADDSLWNLYRDLTRAPDVPYILVHRVRGQKDSTEAFEIGDEIDLYYVHTDVQVPGFGDSSPIQVGQTMVPKNVVNLGHKITA